MSMTVRIDQRDYPAIGERFNPELRRHRCALEKFGGDSMTETLRNFEGYCLQLKNY